MKRLLIVAHTPSPNTKTLANEILAGAKTIKDSNIDSSLVSPFDCDAKNVLAQDGLVLFTTENFGGMSGALKDFFERIYYPCLESEVNNQAKPYALVVRAGLDGTGAQIGVDKIVTGLKWRQALPNLLCKGEYTTKFEQQCRELGMSMAAGISNEVF